MKRKEIVEELAQALCNCLANAERNKGAVRALGAKPAVLRGMAYGLGIAVSVLEGGIEDFDWRDIETLVLYAAFIDSDLVRGLDIEERIGRLIGHEVGIVSVGKVKVTANE